MKKTVRAIFLTVLSIALFVSAGAFPAIAATGQCEYYVGSNAGAQNYSVRSKPVNSYLSVTADGQLMRFQGDADAAQYIAEYYDSGYNLLRTVKIDKELPIFGAFYSDGRNYYVLSGQMNSTESDSVEVYRLTKYDLNWNRLGSAGLFGANTYIPFDAGSARIDSDGNLLFVRTCHEMYMSSDGYHHQANVTIEFNTNSMTVVDSFYSVMNIGYGYVSHSFNQFIKLDGGQIIGVDHGDAYPRSVVLCKYNSPYSASGFSKNTSAKDLLTIPGQTGANATGVSVGGFELSSENYLVAGNTVDLGVNYKTGGTRNIFLAVQPKDLSSSGQVKYITSYPEGDTSPQTPHLVKVNDNAFFLLWEKDGTVNYCKTDGSGNMVGSIYSMEGALSDCVPVLYNGKLIWYTWKNENTTFYSINTNNLSDTVSETVLNGHKFQVEYATEENNVASRVCSVCGYRDSFTTLDGFSVWWWHGWSGYASISRQQNEGEEYSISMRSANPESAENQELELVSSDPSVIEVEGDTFRFIGAGEASLTVRAKYRPSVSLTASFMVSHVLGEETTVREATCSETGLKSQTCSVCGKTVNTEIPALGHDFGDWTVVKPATEEAEGLEERVCKNDPSHKETRPIPKKDHVHVLEKIAAKPATCTEPGNIEYWTCTGCEHLFKDAAGKEEINTENTVIAATGHTPAAAVHEKEVAATCETAGSYEEVVYCAVCNKELSREKKTIAALGHDWGEWTVVTPATEEAEGLEERVCKNDPAHKETRPIEKKQPAADYTAVDAATAKVPSDLSIYTDSSVEALKKALDSVDRDLTASDQQKVNAMATAIKEAIAALEIKPNGFYNIDGTWKYYENGVFAKKTGMVKRISDGKWFYVENGVFNNKATGVVQRVDNKKYYYVKNGKYDNTFTGVATGVKDKKTYYITKGQLKAVTGVFADGKRWKYFVDGKFSASTGIVARSADKKWVYIDKGIVTASTGMAKRLTDNKWLYVEKGVLAKKTGLVQRISDKKWFYVQNGVFNNKYTGGVKRVSDNKWFYVEKGQLKKSTGLAKCTDGKYRYFKSGSFNTYTGKVKLMGTNKVYKVKNGILVK